MNSRLIGRSLVGLGIWVLLGLVVLPLYEHAAAQADLQTDLDAIDDYLGSEMRDLRIPGMEAVIVSGDQVVYSQGFGKADTAGRSVTPQTPMLLGSVSKGVTALAVMQLVEAGKLDLDAPVSHYLPWFRMAGRPEFQSPDPWTQITPRQLLHHTSGIAEYTGANTWNSRYAGDDALERQVRSFAEVPLRHTPGEVFEYSNANYELLGLLVQTVSGRSYESYLQEHILSPLEMHHTYPLAAELPALATGYRYWFGRPLPAPNLPIPRAHVPSAMLISTAEDMGHYLIAQMNGGRYKDVQVLSAQGIAELHRPGVPIGDGHAYAMGWMVAPDGSFFHNGETPGFTSGIRIEDGWGVFVVRNIAANQREQRLDEIAPGILQLVRGQTPAQNTLNPSFRRTMIELGVLLALQLAVLLWSLLRFRRWARRPESAPPKIVRMLLAVLPLLAIDLALIALLWYMGPISSHRTFSVQALGAPDQMLLLGSNLVLASAAAILQLLKAAWLWLSRFHRMAARG